jgi:hypothetical protein
LTPPDQPKENAVILSPLAEWQRPTWRRHLEREGYDRYLAARVRACAGWWEADDVLGAVGNAAGRASSNNYRPIDRDKLTAVVEALGKHADRLVVREFITQPKDDQ